MLPGVLSSRSCSQRSPRQSVACWQEKVASPVVPLVVPPVAFPQRAKSRDVHDAYPAPALAPSISILDRGASVTDPSGGSDRGQILPLTRSAASIHWVPSCCVRVRHSQLLLNPHRDA